MSEDFPMTVKMVDKKGRITLGKQYANATMLVEEKDGGTVITLKRAEAVPVKEAWLFRNTEALGMVMRGLEGAKNRQFSKTPPDIYASWIDELVDPDELADPEE